MNSQTHESRPPTGIPGSGIGLELRKPEVRQYHIGVHVRPDHLSCVIRLEQQQISSLTLDNTRKGQGNLTKSLLQLEGEIFIALQPNGQHYMDLGLMLRQYEHIRVMVVHPMSLKQFAQGLASSRDLVVNEAEVLALYVETQNFIEWEPPPDYILDIRSYARRLASLQNTKDIADEELASLEAVPTTPSIIVHEAKAFAEDISRNMATLRRHALRLISRHEPLNESFKKLTEEKHLPLDNAIRILADIAKIQHKR